MSAISSAVCIYMVCIIMIIVTSVVIIIIIIISSSSSSSILYHGCWLLIWIVTGPQVDKTKWDWK